MGTHSCLSVAMMTTRAMFVLSTLLVTFITNGNARQIDFHGIDAPLITNPCGGSIILTFSEANKNVNGIRGITQINQVDLDGNCCFVMFKKRNFGPGPSFRVDYRGLQQVPRQLKTMRSIKKVPC